MVPIMEMSLCGMGYNGKQKKKKAPWEKEVRKPKGQPDVITQ